MPDYKYSKEHLDSLGPLQIKMLAPGYWRADGSEIKFPRDYITIKEYMKKEEINKIEEHESVYYSGHTEGYSLGYVHGLEYALKLVKYNQDKYGDLSVNNIFYVVHKEIKVLLQNAIEGNSDDKTVIMEKSESEQEQNSVKN